MVDSVPQEAAKPNEHTPFNEDRQRGGWSATLKVVGAGGAGIFADGYDLQVINLAIAIMEKVYPQEFTNASKSFSATMTLVGVIVGQISFGSVADYFGRKRTSLVVASLTVGGAVASACIVNSPGMSIAISLGICRFFLGLGIGGEYPLSAAISKEAGGGLTLTRSQLLITNMALFNTGATVQSILVWALVSGGASLEATWRLALGCGALPSLVAVALRFQMHVDEPESATSVPPPETHVAQLMDAMKGRWCVLLGCCVNWFVFNYTAYGQGAFSSIICDSMLGIPADEMKVVMRNAVFSFIISVCNLAGTVSAYVLEKHLSRFHIQTVGFWGMAISVWISGGLYGHIPASAGAVLVVTYAVATFHMAYVGVSTYLLATESFHKSARGTCVGTSSASGKIGGAVGIATFPFIQTAYGLDVVLISSGFISFIGVLSTWLLTPRDGPGQLPEPEK